MPSTFEQLREAAILNDAIKITHLTEYDSIDIWKPGAYFYSAVTDLATQTLLHENEASPLNLAQCYETVEFLLQAGASLNYAVLGAALINNHKYVKALIDRGANITFAAMGYAQAGNFSMVAEYLKLGAAINLVATFIGMGFSAEKETPEKNQERFSFAAELDSNKTGQIWCKILFGASLMAADDLIIKLLPDDVKNRLEIEKAILAGKAFRGDETCFLPPSNLPNGASNNPFAMLMFRGMGGHSNINCPEGQLNNFRKGLAVAGRLADLKSSFLSNENEMDKQNFINQCFSNDLPFNLVGGFHAHAYHKFFSKLANNFYYLVLLEDWQRLNEAMQAYLNDRWGFLPTDHDLGRIGSDPEAGFKEIKSRSNINFLKKLIWILPFINDDMDRSTFILFRAARYEWGISEGFNVTILGQSHKFNLLSMRQSQNISLTNFVIACNVDYKDSLVLMTLLLNGKSNTFNKLQKNLMLKVASYLFPFELSYQDWYQLQFLTSRAYLCAQLKCYEKAPTSLNPYHASSFRKRIAQEHSSEQYYNLLAKQKSIIAGRNPYGFFEKVHAYARNLTKGDDDKYEKIIEKWTPGLSHCSL